MGKIFGNKRHRPRKIGEPEIVNPWIGLSKYVIAVAVIGPTLIALVGFGFLDFGGSATAAITGRADIIDGDTLRIDGQSIRLHGIDAPEKNQECTDSSGGRWRCGHHATVALERKIGWKSVACEGRGNDRYGRLIAVCEVGDENLNAWMVRQGWAVAYTRYSYRFVPDEFVARFHGRGIWFGDFMAPEDWRRQHRR